MDFSMSTTSFNTIEKLRITASKTLAGINVLILLALMVLTSMYEMASYGHVYAGIFLTLLSGALAWHKPLSFNTHAVIVTSILLLISFVVYVAGLGTYQIDMHMFYFAIFSAMVLFLDWRIILLATAVMCTHHLVLNFTMPSYFFPDGADFARVMLHASALIVPTAVMVYVCHFLYQALSRLAVASESVATSMENMDLNVAFDDDGTDESAQLGGELNGFFGALRSVITNVRTSFSHVNDNAVTITKLTHELRDMSADQKNGIKQLHEAIDSTTESINEINFLAKESSVGTHRVAEMSATAKERMSEVTKSATEISTVTKVIMDISDQTNLLALNASIEAARAGEAGRGFAVVADEVKKLAEDTNNSISQIQQVVDGLHSNVSETTDVVDTISQSAESMNEQIERVSSSVETQSAAIEEISATASSFLARIEDVDRNIQEAGDAASSLENERIQMEKELSTFKI